MASVKKICIKQSFKKLVGEIENQYLKSKKSFLENNKKPRNPLVKHLHRKTYIFSKRHRFKTSSHD